MFPAQLPAALLTLLLAGFAAGQTGPTSEAFSVDFYTDVLYDPPVAWQSLINNNCGGTDTSTSTVNASATINFVGEHFAR